jgi:hypothetical protein
LRGPNGMAIWPSLYDEVLRQGKAGLHFLLSEYQPKKNQVCSRPWEGANDGWTH